MHISTPMTAERLKRVKEIDPSKIAVLDTETTGLDPKNDEVLSLSIVDGAGEMLFDSLIRPSRRKWWPKAQEIHGISPADVADAPTLVEVSDEVRGILRGADLVVGYNVEFDLGMLEAGGLDLYFPTFCVMKEFAPVEREARGLCLVQAGPVRKALRIRPVRGPRIARRREGNRALLPRADEGPGVRLCGREQGRRPRESRACNEGR